MGSERTESPFAPGPRSKHTLWAVGDVPLLLRQVSPTLSVRAWCIQEAQPHRSIAHSTVEIAWAEGGAPTYVVGSRRLETLPSAVMIVPARVEHETKVTRGTRAHVLGLSQAAIVEAADALGLRAELHAQVSPSRRLLRLCEHIFEEAVEPAAGHDLAIDALTEALAVELLRTGEAEPRPSTAPVDLRIRRALAFIEASYAEPLSLDAIAKAAGMSRFHFGRVFEAEVGKSPYRHLIDLRIERAAALIRTGRVSVTEAALSVGFNDLGRFGRAFRARHGVNPSEALAASRSRAGTHLAARAAGPRPSPRSGTARFA
jgi:AraC family transcriptional regulator